MNFSSSLMLLELSNEGRLEGGDRRYMNIVGEVKYFAAGLPACTSVQLMKLVGMMVA